MSILPWYGVDVSESVTYIGSYAFSGCAGIKEYLFYPDTPPTLASANAFGGINSICKIKVPAASLSAYQTAPNWSNYADYMEAM